MNTFRKKKSGFTLIELLIVIVILGILAALVVPRLISNTSRARNAEAVNMLGAIRRAQLAQMDQAGSTVILAASCTGAAGVACAGNATWLQLGLGPLPTSRRFSYACNINTGVCVATRLVGGGTVTMNVDTGLLGCTAPMTNIVDAANIPVGCNG